MPGEAARDTHPKTPDQDVMRFTGFALGQSRQLQGRP